MAQNQNVDIKATVEVNSKGVDQYNKKLDETAQKTDAAFNPKKALKEANLELIKAQEKFGMYSTEALNAAKKVANLRDTIQDANETAALFDPGKKFGAYSNALQSITGAFAGVQGAIGLLGVESDQVEKQLLKVQSALALSEGLSQIGDIQKKFTDLGAVIKSQVVTAFSTLKGAIAATGIGLLTVALGLLISNWDAVKKAVLDAVPGLAKAGEAIGKVINRITDFIGATSEAGRQTSKLIKDNENAIKGTERFLDLNADKYDQYTQRKIKANLEFKKKQNEFLNDEKLTEAQRNEFIKQARDQANREIVRSDADRNKALSDAAREAAEKAAARQNERLAKIRKEEEEAFKIRKEAAERNIKDIGTLNNKDAENTSANIKQQIADETAIQALIPKRIEPVKAVAQSENQLAELKTKNANAEKIIDEQTQVRKEQNLRDNLAKSSEALGFIANALGKQTAVGKAAAISEATINTYLSANKAYQSYSGIPVVGVPLGIAAAAAAVIAGFKNVKAIAATKTPGGGGAGVSAPPISAATASAPIVPQAPQAQTTTLDQQSINQLGSVTSRAYVVESDVTNSQERISRINRAARFG